MSLMQRNVVKRSGEKEPISYDKVTQRIQRICEQLNLKNVNPYEIAQVTIGAIYDNITTEELDIFASAKCAERISIHPEYNKLAAALCASNLQKITGSDFMKVTNELYNNTDFLHKKNSLISEEYYQNVIKNIDQIQAKLDYSRDYSFDYFGIKTLERSYLHRIVSHNNNNNTDSLNKKYGRLVECPQHMFMRVALGIHHDDLEMAFKTYDLMSQRYYTHATPTLYNAGSEHAQLASCFLLGMNDCLKDIFETISDISSISKWAGGIGVHVTDVRAFGSLIRGTNGKSDGIIPMIKVLNSVSRYVNQGGRRNGSIAVYLEPWHSDIYKFCELRKATGAEELRARDIFLALWIPDLFMKRVEKKQKWSLMCPDECPGLTKTYGDEFEALYEKYEKEKRYRSQIDAEELWKHIMAAQLETGVPYIAYKDHVNRKTNQQNIGVIQSSNLCCEICEYSDQDTISVCNLSSICLPAFLEKETDVNSTNFGKLVFNYDKLSEVAQVATKSLDRVIDRTYYSIEKSQKSNSLTRPIGLGVQGLADVYLKLEIPFYSDEAALINKKIFETIYYGSLKASIKLAKLKGPYPMYQGSPFSKGILQWHMWGLTQQDLLKNWPSVKESDKKEMFNITKDNSVHGGWDWAKLIEKMGKHGVRNSLLTALMPTATTSQIMNCNECFEPITSNLYRRTTLTGEYVIINNVLVEKLIELGLWTPELREELIYDKGSIQKIEEIPKYLKDIFKTSFEMQMKPVIKQSIDRGPFIDQSQSMNLFISEPDTGKLHNAHFYGWKGGLKTGMYYLRSRPAVDPLQFGLDPLSIRRIEIKRGIITSDSIDISTLSLNSSNLNESNDDPRRINEIAQSQKPFSKPKYNCSGNADGVCEMCSS